MHLMAKLFEYFDTSIACNQAPREGRAIEPVDILLMPPFRDNAGIMNWLVKSLIVKYLTDVSKNRVDGPTQLLRFVTFEHLLFFGNFPFLDQRRIGALKTVYRCTRPALFASLDEVFFQRLAESAGRLKSWTNPPQRPVTDEKVVGLLWQWRQIQTKSSVKHVQLLPVLLKLTFGAQIKICQSLYPPMEQIGRYYKLDYFSMYYLTNWPISLPLCISIYFLCLFVLCPWPKPVKYLSF